MALINGDNFILGDLLSFQQANRLKDHWRAASVPSNFQPGMLYSDSDDDKLYHGTAGSGIPLEEVLQETKSADVSPIFDNLFLDLDSASVSDPPTDAQLKSKFGNPPIEGFIGFLKNTSSGSNKVYKIFADGTDYFYQELTKAT
jgi:hypothetical protein